MHNNAAQTCLQAAIVSGLVMLHVLGLDGPTLVMCWMAGLEVGCWAYEKQRVLVMRKLLSLT